MDRHPRALDTVILMREHYRLAHAELMGTVRTHQDQGHLQDARLWEAVAGALMGLINQLSNIIREYRENPHLKEGAPDA